MGQALQKGKVYLVGAGPGAPGLLTVRSLELLKIADVIAYDALISPSVLICANPDAELISIGYRGYGSSKLPYRIHPKVIEKAKEGKTVVRLKSGDPLIFGRAAQECEELLENEIDFEIVPGITSGIGAAAYTGVALTHRDFASDVIIASGHDLRGGSPSKSDWAALGKGTSSVILYMVASKVKENCQRLVESGRSSETPALFISEASRGAQREVVGTLADLHLKIGEIPKSTPALIIVGDTIQLKDRFDWFHRKALHRFTLLLVRARVGESSLARMLKDEGADVIEAPWVLASPLKDTSELDDSIMKLYPEQNLIFSCEVGVQYFLNRLVQLKRDLRSWPHLKILALDQKIESKLQSCGIRADAVLQGHCMNSLRSHRDILIRQKNLVVTSQSRRPQLQEFFKYLEIEASFQPAYDLNLHYPEFDAPQVDFVILPSSSSARSLYEGPWGMKLKMTPAIAMGPITAEAARKLGAMNVSQTASDQLAEVMSFLQKQ
jgi:uroporphyrinogen III methyltransferase / synthase